MRKLLNCVSLAITADYVKRFEIIFYGIRNTCRQMTQNDNINKIVEIKIRN